MHKSDRLFQLTNILRAHQPITARELAEKISVSERTIYRYIDSLSTSGIPVYGEPGVGYRLSEGFDLPPLQLTQEELEALVIGVNMTSSWTGPKLSKASNSLMNKIEAALPNGFIHQSGLQRQVRTPGEHLQTIDFTNWDKLHAAIKEKQWLNISYQSLSNKKTTRVVFPLGLFYWGGKWTLGSWCNMRKEYRDFRVDCIKNLVDALAPKVHPKSMSLSDYLECQQNKS
ncbi:MAG: helix-turn-helix transcriptional regulator [Arenicella sp.]